MLMGCEYLGSCNNFDSRFGVLETPRRCTFVDQTERINMDQSTTTTPTPRAKLTDHEVALIHEMLEDGMSPRQVAQKFEEAMAR